MYPRVELIGKRRSKPHVALLGQVAEGFCKAVREGVIYRQKDAYCIVLKTNKGECGRFPIIVHVDLSEGEEGSGIEELPNIRAIHGMKGVVYEVGDYAWSEDSGTFRSLSDNFKLFEDLYDATIHIYKLLDANPPRFRNVLKTIEPLGLVDPTASVTMLSLATCAEPADVVATPKKRATARSSAHIKVNVLFFSTHKDSIIRPTDDCIFADETYPDTDDDEDEPSDGEDEQEDPEPAQEPEDASEDEGGDVSEDESASEDESGSDTESESESESDSEDEEEDADDQQVEEEVVSPVQEPQEPTVETSDVVMEEFGGAGTKRLAEEPLAEEPPPKKARTPEEQEVPGSIQMQYNITPDTLLGDNATAVITFGQPAQPFDAEKAAAVIDGVASSTPPPSKRDDVVSLEEVVASPYSPYANGMVVMPSPTNGILVEQRGPPVAPPKTPPLPTSACSCPRAEEISAEWKAIENLKLSMVSVQAQQSAILGALERLQNQQQSASATSESRDAIVDQLTNTVNMLCTQSSTTDVDVRRNGSTINQILKLINVIMSIVTARPAEEITEKAREIEDDTKQIIIDNMRQLQASLQAQGGLGGYAFGPICSRLSGDDTSPEPTDQFYGSAMSQSAMVDQILGQPTPSHYHHQGQDVVLDSGYMQTTSA